MYRVSRLPRKVLITTDEVIKLAGSNQDMDPRILLSAIQVAEDRFIKQAICKAMYYDFRDKKNTVVTTVNKTYLESLFTGVTLAEGDIVNAIEFVDNDYYKQLWNEYLWKISADCVLYAAMPVNFIRSTAQGEMLNNPQTITNEGQGAVSTGLKEVQWKMDKIFMDWIDPSIQSMHEWMCDNKGWFPLYTCKECSTTEDGVSYQRKSAWIHDIYDNEPCGCYDDRPNTNCN